MQAGCLPATTSTNSTSRTSEHEKYVVEGVLTIKPSTQLSPNDPLHPAHRQSPKIPSRFSHYSTLSPVCPQRSKNLFFLQQLVCLEITTCATAPISPLIPIRRIRRGLADLQSAFPRCSASPPISILRLHLTYTMPQISTLASLASPTFCGSLHTDGLSCGVSPFTSASLLFYIAFDGLPPTMSLSCSNRPLSRIRAVCSISGAVRFRIFLARSHC